MQGEITRADLDDFLDTQRSDSRATLTDSAPTDSDSNVTVSDISGGSHHRAKASAKGAKKPLGARFTIKKPKATPLEFNKNNGIKGGAKQEQVLLKLIKKYNLENKDKKIKMKDGRYSYDDTMTIQNVIIPAYNRSL